jgi:hypothetical protein
MNREVEVIIDTPFGKARLVVHGKGSCYLGNLNSPHENPLTVNRVEYSISMHAELHDGQWGYQRNSNGQVDCRSLHMVKIHWDNINQRDASHAARKKVEETFFDLLNTYFAEHPEALVAGEQYRLRSEMGRQLEKVKEAVLLQEEARQQVEATRDELLAILTVEEQCEALNAERERLSLEMVRWLRRTTQIEDRQKEICEQIAQLDGRRGAASRFLSGDEIDKLGEYFSAGDFADELGDYLRESIFGLANGQCYEVPVTFDEGLMMDEACELLGIGQ